MARFVEGVDRGQITLFPALLDDYVSDDNPVRAVDVFVDELDLDKLGFVGIQPLDRGRPSYHPGMLLKLYIYGYLNRVPSSRRLERESARSDARPIAGPGVRFQLCRNVSKSALIVCASVVAMPCGKPS
jgi:transposase